LFSKKSKENTTTDLRQSMYCYSNLSMKMIVELDQKKNFESAAI